MLDSVGLRLSSSHRKSADAGKSGKHGKDARWFGYHMEVAIPLPCRCAARCNDQQCDHTDSYLCSLFHFSSCVVAIYPAQHLQRICRPYLQQYSTRQSLHFTEYWATCFLISITLPISYKRTGRVSDYYSARSNWPCSSDSDSYQLRAYQAACRSSAFLPRASIIPILASKFCISR